MTKPALFSRSGLGLAGLVLCGLACPALAQTPAPPLPIPSGLVTELECFRDSGGNLHKLAEDVTSSDGQTVGWVSISQCPAGTPDGKLHVRLSGSFGDNMVIFDPKEVSANAGSIILTLTAAQVRARFPHATPALSSALYPTAP